MELIYYTKILLVFVCEAAFYESFSLPYRKFWLPIAARASLSLQSELFYDRANFKCEKLYIRDKLLEDRMEEERERE